MPLGRPVVPDEYIQNAMSSRPVSASASRFGKSPSHGTAATVATGSRPVGSPLTTISADSCVPATASGLSRSSKEASTTATSAPESRA